MSQPVVSSVLQVHWRLVEVVLLISAEVGSSSISILQFHTKCFLFSSEISLNFNSPWTIFMSILYVQILLLNGKHSWNVFRWAEQVSYSWSVNLSVQKKFINSMCVGRVVTFHNWIAFVPEVLVKATWTLHSTDSHLLILNYGLGIYFIATSPECCSFILAFSSLPSGGVLKSE